MVGYLEQLRGMEFQVVEAWLKPGIQVLEIGGGSGYQASLIAARGCEVLSIDLSGSGSHPFYPVQEYDGRDIPVPNARFDLVFSSNVLEHVKTLTYTLSEVRRVMKPGGVAIHILPSATWRLWTSLFYYVHLWRRIGQRAESGERREQGSEPASLCSLTSALYPHGHHPLRGYPARVRRTLVHPALPHGEYPSALAELYCFSRRRWLQVFQENGFRVEKVAGTHLFYTGFGFLPGLSAGARRRIARLLGSSCHVFVMRIPSHASTMEAAAEVRSPSYSGSLSSGSL